MPEPIDPELSDVASALAALRPNPPAIDRDRLLYEAGRASAPRAGFWRMATAASVASAAVLAAALLFRPAPPPVERVVYVQVEPPKAPTPPARNETPPAAAPAESEPPTPPLPWPRTPYARLEDRVLRWGLDGLAAPASTPEEPPPTVDSLLKSL